MNVSKRLRATLELIGKVHTLVDVGTDHGYLAIKAVQEGIAQFVIASDNKEEPLQTAIHHIKQAGLGNYIKPILADGLVFLEQPVDVVVIMGMGGKMIESILDKAPLSLIDTFIVGPNSEAISVRLWLSKHHYQIIDEVFLDDKGKHYQIIKAIKGHMTLTAQELEFGPINLKEQSPVLRKTLHKLIDKLEAGLPKTSIESKRKAMEERIALLRSCIDERN